MTRPTIRAANYAHLIRPAPASPIRTAQAPAQPTSRTAPTPQPSPRPAPKGNDR